MLTITAVVPTYRRPNDLRRCIEHLRAQTRLPQQIIVIVREDDSAGLAVLDELDAVAPDVQRVTVNKPGVVEALNTALDHVTSEVVAITDDDGAPHWDWLANIESRLAADSGLGGVGGPDWIGGGPLNGASDRCGRMQWFGRVEPCGQRLAEVDVLKGCNMAFRTAAIGPLRFDERLLGSGVQYCNEYDMCLQVRRSGWRLVYDPDVAIDHFESGKPDGIQRAVFVASPHAETCHNMTLMTLDHLSWPNRIAYVTYLFGVGSAPAPGLAAFVRSLLRREPDAFALWKSTVRGELRGIRTFLRVPRPAPCRRDGTPVTEAKRW